MRVLFLSVCALSVAVGQDVNTMRGMPKYDQRYDYLDVDAILDNKRLVSNYVDCLINVKPCTPEGKALKRILPEALRTKCVRCTENQKRTAVKVIKRLKYEYSADWAKLSSRWDPTGDFTRFFEEFLAKEHFNTIPNYGNEIPSVPSLPPVPQSPPRVPQSIPSTPVQPLQPTVQPAPQPSAQPPTQPAMQPMDTSTSPRPIILNRFGDDGELVVGSSTDPAKRQQTTQLPMRPITMPVTVRPIMQTRPTQMTWASAGSDNSARPATDMPPPYTTAITLIDQIGYKIMRTTELVTDILKNTVRAVVGR